MYDVLRQPKAPIGLVSDPDDGSLVARPYLRSWRKMMLDWIVLAFVLPVALVIGGVVALVILLTEGRPILYAQMRVGRDGQSFRCLKFRTMVRDADAVLAAALAASPERRAEWASTRKLRDDPRVNGLGRFLRETSLDELPQLLNVMRGDMTLVGPRPIVREELALYGRYAEAYCAVTPGVTGFWQVTGRSDTTYRRRVAMDMRYLRTASLGGDIVILLSTIRALFTGRGAY